MTASRERALALALVGGFLRRERRTARTLLRAERLALGTLRAAAASVAARATLATSGEGVDLRDAMVTVRRATPAMRDAVERALLDVRAAARRAAREEGPGAARARATPHEEDSAAAHTTASSYAAAWGAAAVAALLARRDSGKEVSARAFSHAPLDYRLRRIATTETARAFNDERARGWEGSGEPHAGVFKVWSAVLDRRTCAHCFERDGRTLELHASFGESPPAHVSCRCVLELVVVPRPERLEDVAVDYEAFKREMRDVLRERRVPSEHHAGAFLKRSMGRSRSPVALTRKFASLGG